MLLIVTDGVISDMAQTKESIVNVSGGQGGSEGPGIQCACVAVKDAPLLQTAPPPGQLHSNTEAQAEMCS